MTDSLEITLHSDPTVALMYLRGGVNIESSPRLRDGLLAMLRRESPPKVIAIDLAGVTYLDTSGIATLIEALKVARTIGIAIRLEGLKGRILQLFQATGIGALFATGGSTNDLSAASVSS